MATIRAQDERAAQRALRTLPDLTESQAAALTHAFAEYREEITDWMFLAAADYSRAKNHVQSKALGDFAQKLHNGDM